MDILTLFNFSVHFSFLVTLEVSSPTALLKINAFNDLTSIGNKSLFMGQSST